MPRIYKKKTMQYPSESIAWILHYITKNKRSFRSGYRAFCDYFCNGGSIPGLGTWKELWVRDNKSSSLHTTCPYIGKMPAGLSQQSLRRALSDFGATALRTGMMKATMANIPQIRRTRYGLQSCSVVQVDDMWHEVKVAYGRNKFISSPNV